MTVQSEHVPEYVNVDHISLTVRDMDAAKHFYADLLGIPVVSDVLVDDKVSNDDAYEGLYAAKHPKRRLVVLGPVGGVNLALIAHPGDELAGEASTVLDGVGLNHFALNVRDLPALIERMASFGISPVAAGYFKDPEGNLIQFEAPGESQQYRADYLTRAGAAQAG